MLADISAVEVELVGSVAAIISAIAVMMKFFVGFFRRLEAKSDAFQKAIADDGKQARAAYLADLVRRDDQFLKAIERADDRHVASVLSIEAEHARQRDEDRKQREEDRRLIERLAKIDSGSWKTQAQAQAPTVARPSQPTPQREREQRRRPSDAGPIGGG